MENLRFKFRVWDSSANAYVPRSQFILLSDGTLIQEIGGEEVIWESTEPESCTGLRDKNGKLIYEGDIVTDGTDIFEVIWDYNAWCIQTNKFQHFLTEGFEILGNIHENADLLENEE